MLITHTLQYVLARGAPGIVNLLAIVLYTRMVSPESYGLYALAVTGVSFFNIVFCHWVQLSLLRFYPQTMSNPGKLLATMLVALVLSCLPAVLTGLGLLFVAKDADIKLLIVIAIPLVCAQAWFDLNLELARSQLDTIRYGTMSAMRAIAGLIMGLVLVYFGFGAWGLLGGLLFGCLAGVALVGTRPWKVAIGQLRERDSLRPYLAYGLPLTMTFAMAFVISGSDRLLLTYFLGPEATGVYSAGYDLVWNFLTLLFVVVNLAAYPLVVRALESLGPEEAAKQCAENGTLLLLVAAPTAALLIYLAPEISAALLGTQYSEEATRIIPWVVVAAVVAGLRAYHFDLAFQLSKKTIYQVWILGVAATINLGMNAVLIPSYGPLGAAYATIVAYSVSLIMSIVLGRNCFRVKLQWGALAKIISATAAAVAMVALLPGVRSVFWLVGAVGLATVIYLAIVLAFDVLGVRKMICRKLLVR